MHSMHMVPASMLKIPLSAMPCVKPVVYRGPSSHLPLVLGELNSERVVEGQGGFGTGNELLLGFIIVLLNK